MFCTTQLQNPPLPAPVRQEGMLWVAERSVRCTEFRGLMWPAFVQGWDRPPFVQVRSDALGMGAEKLGFSFFFLSCGVLS